MSDDLNFLMKARREKLDRLAKAWGCPRSVAVARLVREAEEPAET